MSDGTVTRAGQVERWLIAGVVAIALGVLAYLAAQRQTQLRADVTGFDGLSSWLVANDVPTDNFLGGWQIDPSSIGLNIIPIYDTQIGETRVSPTTKEELLFQQDENDISGRDLLRKLTIAKSLVILPKWRSGLRLTGLAHPELLSETARIQSILDDITSDPKAKVRRIRQPFTSFEYVDGLDRSLDARMYVAQVFAAKGCTPIIGDVGAMILGECRIKQGTDAQTVFILSDPDLMNNQGLRLGDNANIAKDFIAREKGEGSVLIDYSSRNWFSVERDETARERTWSDLLRFFEYPFSILWISGGLTLVLVLWRAGMRFGPVPASSDALSASRSGIVSARARLLRLTNQDGALLAEYVPARLSAVSTKLFGPAYGRKSADKAAIVEYLRRSSPDDAHVLDELLETIAALPKVLPPRETIQYIDKLEQILEQISHET